MTATYIGPDDGNVSNDPVILLNNNNMVQAILPNKQKVLILCDTGASKSLISETTINSSPYISKLEKQHMDPISFKLGNGDIIVATYAVNVTLNIQGHNCFGFEINEGIEE